MTLSVVNGIPGYALPSFVTLTDNGGGNGILHFNPPAGNRGTYTLTLLATDNGDGLGSAGVQTGSYTFVVTVESPTQVPVLNYIGDQVAVIGQPFTLNLNASETDQDSLTYAVSGLPAAAHAHAGNVLRIGHAQLDADRGRHRCAPGHLHRDRYRQRYDHAAVFGIHDDPNRRPLERHGAGFPGRHRQPPRSPKGKR